LQSLRNLNTLLDYEEAMRLFASKMDKRKIDPPHDER